MPTAPDLATVFDITAGVEKALKAVIQALPVGVKAFTQQENGTLPKERVDVTFTQGQWTGSFQKGRDNVLRRSAWHYTLTLEVSKSRSDDSLSRHSAIRGALAAMMQDGETFGPGSFPYQVLSTVFEAGITPGVSIKDGHDTSEMHFYGVVSIRRDAWPSQD